MVSSNLFNEYKVIFNQLTTDYKKAVELERMEVDKEQRRAINLIEQTLSNIVLLGVLTIISSIFSGYFIANSISKPVRRLKLATIEVGKGNLDTLVEQKSKDEVGDLEISFSLMTEELKKSREKLLLAKKYTSKILRSMTDALIVTSLNGSIITVNNAVCAMLKYKKHELIGQTFTNIYLKEELQFNKAQFDKLVEDGCDNKFEATYLAKDGSKIPVSFTNSLMLNEEQ